MAEVPPYLEPWMVTQRWFAGKARAPRLEVIGGYVLDAGADVDARVLFVLDHAESPLLYQVPLTVRSAPVPGLEQRLVARDGELYVYDGPHDPALAGAMLRLALDAGTATSIDGSGDPVAAGHGDLAAPPRIRSSRVLGGEQSNTSIVFEMSDADGGQAPPVICKVFRALHDGENPDVVLTGALAAAGSRVAPRSVGSITGSWRDRSAPGGVATGHLAFAQEFFPGVEDAWRVASVAIAAGESFGRRAYELGSMTAEMHATLAVALPSASTTPSDIATVVSAMRARFEMAAREVPSLEQHRDHVEGVYHAAAESPWPPLQRIHGDYHLGQVLDVPGRGWVALDFEGEPLRAMRERSGLDSPLRDVAGMLRSFDYAAGSFRLDHPGQTSGDWASECRHAFLDGYIERSGRDLRSHRALLDAFEIDKALYEAVYEARNRPGWLSIPTDAIARLATR